MTSATPAPSRSVTTSARRALGRVLPAGVKRRLHRAAERRQARRAEVAVPPSAGHPATDHATVRSGTLQDAVADAIASARPLITQDIWNRFQLYQLDGNLIPVIKALNEMYNRVGRIEAKLDRLLGDVQHPLQTGKPAERRYRVPLPEAPAGWTAGSAHGARELDLRVHWSMYVPRVLSEKGVGGYEPTSLPHFLAALVEAPDGAFFDVGANVGPYSLLARAFSDRQVVGFEPTPDLASVAADCAHANGLDYRMEQIALGASEGTAQLYLSDSTDSSNSLNPRFRPNTFVVDVDLERLDHYVERTGIRPGLLKVDTETTEPEVLRGAVETVRDLRPWILCEVLHGTTEPELTKIMADWGYTWYYLDGVGPLAERDEIVGDPALQNFMWLFTPEPLPERHWELARAWSARLDETPPGQEVAV